MSYRPISSQPDPEHRQLANRYVSYFTYINLSRSYISNFSYTRRIKVYRVKSGRAAAAILATDGELVKKIVKSNYDTNCYMNK